MSEKRRWLKLGKEEYRSYILVRFDQTGDQKSLSSIKKLRETYEKRIGNGIILHHGEIKQEENTLWLPYYMAPVI